jgi:hypothetical protein
MEIFEEDSKMSKTKNVTVSREVAEAINYALNVAKPEDVIGWFVKGYWHASEVAVLDSLPLDTLIRALYIGYEVKKSPEHRLLTYIRDIVPEGTSVYDAFNISYLNGKADGAREAAKILRVELSTINGKDEC